jgi:hypothetical protein
MIHTSSSSSSPTTPTTPIREYFNSNKVLRPKPLVVGDLVLLFDSTRELDKTALKKFSDRWSGPFLIAEVGTSGYYKLSELDGTPLRTETE